MPINHDSKFSTERLSVGNYCSDDVANRSLQPISGCEAYAFKHGTRVIETAMLPYPQSFEASNIETRQIVRIYSGELIHAFKMDDILYVSSAYFKKLQQCPAPSNP